LAALAVGGGAFYFLAGSEDGPGSEPVAVVSPDLSEAEQKVEDAKRKVEEEAQAEAEAKAKAKADAEASKAAEQAAYEAEREAAAKGEAVEKTPDEAGADAEPVPEDEAAAEPEAKREPEPEREPEPDPEPEPSAKPAQGALAAAIEGDKIRMFGGMVVDRRRSDKGMLDDAEAHCAERDIDGVGGWRLPTVEEMAEIVGARLVPRDYYWTSTPGRDTTSRRHTVYDGLKKKPHNLSPRFKNGRAVCVKDN
jgi:hypothetical protein